ncbi:MAG: cytochrome c biogenesis protein CcdA [Phycisphaeraceae bacterium]
MSVCRRVLLLLCVWLMWPCVLPHRAWAQVGAVSGERPQVVQVQTVWRTPKAHRGDQNLLAVVVDIQSGYHINPDKAQAPSVGDFIPYPSRLTVVEAADELSFEAPRFPAPHPIRVEYADGELMSYQGRVILYLPVKVADDAAAGSYRAAIELEYQACTDTVCFTPATVRLPVTLEVVATGADVGQPNTALFADYEQRGNPVSFDLFGHGFSIDATGTMGLALLLLVAAVGGLLLNLTPCVLPVIPIKIMSLANVSHDSRARTVLLGFVMFLGVAGFWMAIGVAIASIAGLTALNQLFQQPWFTIGVGLVIVVMAVGMCGLFSLRLPDWVYSISPKHESLPGSFGFGIMTGVLSTPCTAPFLGTAAAWAITQSPTTTLVTFLAIGIGMGLPYLILAAFPRLVARLPRTGPGSELIKQVMGLFMLAAAAFFMGSGINGVISDGSSATSQAYWWVVCGFIALGGLWLLIQSLRVLTSRWGRGVFSSVGALTILLALILGVPAGFTESAPDVGEHDGRLIKWVYYTPEAFAAQFEAGRVVVMDFTADWCINCKVLERNVLESDRIVRLLDKLDVVPMKVDITSKANVEGNRMLARMNSVTIPLLVIFDANGKPVFKSDFYTVEQVIDAINKARQ